MAVHFYRLYVALTYMSMIAYATFYYFYGSLSAVCELCRYAMSLACTRPISPTGEEQRLI